MLLLLGTFDPSTSTDTPPESSTTADPTPTSDAETTTQQDPAISEPTSTSSNDFSSTSSSEEEEQESPTSSFESDYETAPIPTTSTQDVAQSATTTPAADPSSFVAPSDSPTNAYATSNTVAIVQTSQDPLLSSSSSSSDVALGDQIATTSASLGNQAISPSSDGSEGSDPNSTGGDDGSSGSGNRDPFLNGAGEGSGQNSKMIGGTVGGIIAAIVIVVVVVWLIGKVSFITKLSKAFFPRPVKSEILSFDYCITRADLFRKNLPQHRRKKFVKPIVERMHTSGSGYSLPSMLNGPNSGSGSGSGSGAVTPAASSHGHGLPVASRRRSRAFSIESASTYDKVDIHTEAGIQTPRSMGNFGLEPTRQEMSQVRSTSMVENDEEAMFLPVGAAPYPYRALHGFGQDLDSSNSRYGPYATDRYNPPGQMSVDPSQRMTATKHHQQLPSGSSFGSHHMLDQARTSPEYPRRQLDFSDAYYGPSSAPLSSSNLSFSQSQSPQRNFYQNARNASPTQEMLIPNLVKSDSTLDFRSPFDDDDAADGSDPVPHSPTMVPTLLQRRTTDPFSNKHSLRVINPDDKRELDSPTISNGGTPVVATPRLRPAVAESNNNNKNNNNGGQEESRPFSNWSSLAPSRASTSTMSDAYSTFHFDTLGGGNGNTRISRADSLDANRRLRLDNNLANLKRSSSAMEFVTREGEILTPRQVNDVGFFRDV